MKQTMAERVHSAAEILDYVQPDWAGLVDLNTLDMAALSTDVARQIGRSYELDYSDEDQYRGLVAMALIPAENEEYPELTATWRIAIGDRQQIGRAHV